MESTDPGGRKRLRDVFDFVWDATIELLAPTRCAGCEEVVGPRGLFCPACVPSLERVSAWDSRNAGHLATFEYGGAVSIAIQRFKYSGRADLGPRLGIAMAQSARHLRGAVDVVIPVPLHPRRLVDRGYNQAALLARPIAHALGVPHLPRGMRRLRDTPHQARLPRRERVANVHEAFIARRDRHIAGQRVLLVDDVRTTGATLEECASALHAVGARQVMAFVLATRQSPSV